jgi:hypothetical protein
MSQPTDNPTPLTVASTATDNGAVVEKPSRRQRVVSFVKSHKKATIAVAALTGLVGVSAYAGRKTAPSIDSTTPEPYEYDPEEYQDVTEPDTTVA